MKKKIKDIFLYFLIAIPTVYILFLLFLYFYQRNLLYHPNENNYFGDNLKIEVDRIKIKTSDNLDLNAWYYEKDKKEFKTLLFFHGNAGLLENRIYKLNALGKESCLVQLFGNGEHIPRSHSCSYEGLMCIPQCCICEFYLSHDFQAIFSSIVI